MWILLLTSTHRRHHKRNEIIINEAVRSGGKTLDARSWVSVRACPMCTRREEATAGAADDDDDDVDDAGRSRPREPKRDVRWPVKEQ